MEEARQARMREDEDEAARGSYHGIGNNRARGSLRILSISRPILIRI